MFRNRRGVTLPELLGAILIMTIVTALLGGITFAIIRTVDRVAVANDANVVGLRLVNRLESAMADAGATAYSTCVAANGCIVLENHYDLVFNDATDTVDVVVHAPALTTTVSVHDGAVWIDGAALDDGNFSIGGASLLAVTDVAGEVTVTIAIELLATDGRLFAYNASHTFQTSDIPA